MTWLLIILCGVITFLIRFIENKNLFLIDNFKLYAAFISIFVALIWNNVLVTISIGMASFLIMSNF